jgi:hypothetical protein
MEYTTIRFEPTIAREPPGLVSEAPSATFEAILLETVRKRCSGRQ